MNELHPALVDIATWLSQSAFNLLIQSTILILSGSLCAHWLRGYGAAVQSAIYRATLLTVLASPVATIALNQSGFDGWMIQIPNPTGSAVERERDPATNNARPTDLPPATTIVNELRPHVSDEFAAAISRKRQALRKSTSSYPAVKSPGADDVAAIVPGKPRSMERSIRNTGWIVIYLFVTLAWLVGIGMFMTRLTMSYRRLSAIRRQSSPFQINWNQRFH